MENCKTAGKLYEVFVSMPYGKDEKSKAYWNRFYHQAIMGVKPLIEGRGYKVNFLRAAEIQSALTLKESVKVLLNRCHICLGVITGLNPNVFWELGYADSLGKPSVLIVEEGVNEAQYSPVLVAAALKAFYDGKVFDKVTPDEGLVLDFQEKVIKFLDLAVSVAQGKEKPLPQYKIFSDRCEAEEAQKIISAERSIDLITTNLTYYANYDEFKAENDGELVYAFDPPIKKGVRVRILVLNPESIITEYRAKQLGRGHEVAEYREELRQAARSFYHRYMNHRNVDIRIYDDLPSQISLIADNDIVSSFISRGQQARFNMHVGVDLDFKGARATFEKHFAEVQAQEMTKHISFFRWAQLHSYENTSPNEPAAINAE